jgi:PII-like signaling protein
MDLQGERVLLRAYLRSADRAPHTPTHDRLLRAARAQGMSGVTVLRGIAGFGSRGPIGAGAGGGGWWSLIDDVPVILELVDDGTRIAAFLDGPVRELVLHGTVTLERAHVMLYRHSRHTGHETTLRLGELLRPLSTLPDIQPRDTMATRQDGVLLRVFIGEDDRADGRPLFDAVMQKARELGLAGATVLRGTAGFGAHSVVRKASLLEMSRDLPIVIEMVDTEAKIASLLPYLESTVQEGMITMEYVLILLYREGGAPAA